MENSLEPAGKIEPQPWLTAAPTQAVIKALLIGGGEARFIGGCVRDALLKRPIVDIDIATTDAPERVMELLKDAGIKAIPTGIKHGTVTAVIGEADFQITTLRVDVETDGRHAKVAFTDDWRADAARRDFTINTMSCTADGNVYDPFRGMVDLANRRVRFVGIPRERIEEDVLRLLRFFRMYATYGEPPPDSYALAACREFAPKLAELSGERVRNEMLRILEAPHPADIIQLMRGERVLEHILPEVTHVGRLRQLSWLESDAVKIQSISPDPLRRLASLLKPDGAAAKAVAKRFVLSRKQTSRLEAMVETPFDIKPEADEATLRGALRRLGGALFTDVSLLAWAAERAISPRQPVEHTQGWISLLETAETWVPPTFPLSGRDVMALGVAAGPSVGTLLSAAEDWWEQGGCQADHQACLEKLRVLLEENSPSA